MLIFDLYMYLLFSNEKIDLSFDEKNGSLPYCKRGNFRVGVIFAFSRFCLLRENYPHVKIKPICLMKEIGGES